MVILLILGREHIDLNEGWGVLLFAWRGYSGNKGNPTENNLYKDAESALKWIEKNTYLQKSDLVIYGESLSTGVAVELGTRYLFKSIVLEAPFIHFRYSPEKIQNLSC